MGTLAILVLFAEEKEWEVQNNSFMNHLFNSSVEKSRFFLCRFRIEVINRFRPGMYELRGACTYLYSVLCVSILSICSWDRHTV